MRAIQGHRPKAAAGRRAAFTLVEMLAVMAIIVLLAGVIIAGSSYAARRSDRNRAIAGIERLKMAINEYRLQYGRVPDSTFNGNMNSGNWGSSDVRNIMGRYTRFPDDFIDPWGRPYIYTNHSRFSYVITSRGPHETETYDDISSEQSLE